ncbi:hypothetical protein FB446DRAFT_755463 [Lentinula raphanica]|nr:hypothetical protein FB446DRAFT_755463 [Lentinula raphanica]
MSQTPQTTTSSRKPSASSKNALKKPTNEELSQFYIAVQDKKDWERKVWDDELVLKWAIEAELLPSGSTVLQGEAMEVIQELRRRSQITKIDQDIILDTGYDISKHRRPVSDIDADFENALKYARGSKYALHEPELREKELGIFVSDDLVPDSVHQELVRELDALAETEPKDFHPHSFGKVQDLIHPSLYPYFAGITFVPPEVKLPALGDVDGQFLTKISNLRDQEMSSAFAWIPSIFKVSPDGTDVEIQSYISGLGTRDQYPSLFRVLEKMFLLALPHFEKTLRMSDVGMWSDFLAGRASKWDAQKREEKDAKEKVLEDIRQEKLQKESFYQLGDEFVASEAYKGQELKVIVKAANYTLTPGREYEGTWHMEGMPHERIVASVIHYYETDDAIEDRGLSFRKFRDSTEDFPNVEESDYRHEDFLVNFTKPTDDNDEDEELQEEEEDYEKHYPSDWETEVDSKGNKYPVFTTAIPSFINLGTVPTTNFEPQTGKTTGRMISFPNWLQLCFFLVDDSVKNEVWVSRPGFVIKGLRGMNVLTTSEVPNQMRKANEPTIRALLPTISVKLTGKEMPPELVDIIWKHAFAETFSREEAEKHRLELMKDRKIKLQSRHGFDTTYSLCEH